MGRRDSSRPECQALQVDASRDRRRAAPLGAVWVALLVALLLAEGGFVLAACWTTFRDRPALRYEAVAVAIYVGALVVLARLSLPRRFALRLIIGTGGVFQAIALLRPPVDSDDDFRYMWDAKVQLAGIDPYRYAPVDQALAKLRDTFLFVPSRGCTVHHIPGGCTRINLPYEHTIYPPVAEALFTLVRVLSFGGQGHHLPLQLAAGAGALGIAALIARRTEGPVWTVALWAWCPVVIMELGNNAHIDWLAVLLGLVALGYAPRAGDRRSAVIAGILLGAAVATKLYPGLLGASMLRRRPITVTVSAIVTVVVVYVPHVMAVGHSVIGDLPAYLNGSGYGGGTRYHLIALIIHGRPSTVIAVVILLAVLIWAVLKTDPDHPERSALLVVGAAVLVTTPGLSWYTLLLLALACVCARPEWLGVVLAPTAAYLTIGAYSTPDRTTTYAYVVGALILVAGTAVRAASTRRSVTMAR